MADVKKVATRTSNRVFIGKAWNNVSKDGATPYTSISFDQQFEVTIRDTKTGESYMIGKGAYITGFANQKREGKKDADLRLSIQLES